MRFMTWRALFISPQQEVQLALRTLGTFPFGASVLLGFVRHTVVRLGTDVCTVASPGAAIAVCTVTLSRSAPRHSPLIIHTLRCPPHTTHPLTRSAPRHSAPRHSPLTTLTCWPYTVVHYLDDDDPGTRREAALTCCRLLEVRNSGSSGGSGLSGGMEEFVMERLLAGAYTPPLLTSP